MTNPTPTPSLETLDYIVYYIRVPEHTHLEAKEALREFLSTHYISKEEILEAIGEDERLRLEATPSLMTLGEAQNSWRNELRTKLNLAPKGEQHPKAKKEKVE